MLSNTTLAMLLATLNASSVLIAMPAIFRGIHLDPLAAGNFNYLLWMLMGYMLVTAVLVVNLGRLGRHVRAGADVQPRLPRLHGRLDPALAGLEHGAAGALELIVLRMVQAVGGALLMANTAALLTDAFPRGAARARARAEPGGRSGGDVRRTARGWAAGARRLAACVCDQRPGRGVRDGLVVLEAARAGAALPRRIDWRGNLAFAAGLTLALVGVTYGIRPYGGHTMGWQNPFVLAAIAAGLTCSDRVRR